MLPLPLITVFYFLIPSVFAGTVTEGGDCSRDNNRLSVGTYEFDSDCDRTTFCNGSGKCQRRGCRKDIFPFGFSRDDNNLPKICPQGQFCPDEGDACQALVAVGGACQLNRDDQCQSPPNAGSLNDKQFGLNVNGAVCLNGQCMWANQTLNQDCVVENTPYIVYFNGGEEIDIVSRGNCQLGFFCDSQSLKCSQAKNVGDSCQADKECVSMNCASNQVCGQAFNVPRHLGSYVYVLVGVGIFGGMIGTLVGLFFLHGKQRDQERERRIQYWREQNAFRQNIMQMRDTTHASLLSLPLGANGGDTSSARSTIIYEDQTPILKNQQPKANAYRHMSDSDGEMDLANMVRERENDGPRFRTGHAF